MWLLFLGRLGLISIGTGFVHMEMGCITEEDKEVSLASQFISKSQFFWILVFYLFWLVYEVSGGAL